MSYTQFDKSSEDREIQMDSMNVSKKSGTDSRYPIAEENTIDDIVEVPEKEQLENDKYKYGKQIYSSSFVCMITLITIGFLILLLSIGAGTLRKANSYKDYQCNFNYDVQIVPCTNRYTRETYCNNDLCISDIVSIALPDTTCQLVNGNITWANCVRDFAYLKPNYTDVPEFIAGLADDTNCIFSSLERDCRDPFNTQKVRDEIGGNTDSYLIGVILNTILLFVVLCSGCFICFTAFYAAFKYYSTKKKLENMTFN